MTYRRKPLLLTFLLCALIQWTQAGESRPISLAGPWRFQLDRADAGVSQRWFERALPDKIKLPGGLTEQGIGDPVTVDTKWIGGIADTSWFTAPEYAPYRQPGNVKIPFWLQPERYYAGAAWFQRDINIPTRWQGKRVVLFLERAHWETRVWVDGNLMGTNTALGTPHECALGQLAPGKHTLTIRVDNRLVIDVGENSHSVSDHTQGNWNGIVGDILLRATGPVWIEDLRVYPHLAGESVTLRGRIGNCTGQAGQGTLAVRVDEAVKRGSLAAPSRATFPASWQADGGSFECEVRVPSPKPWDEFQANLYRIAARIEGQPGITEPKVAEFGFRELATQGTQFAINGRKLFFRGTLECAIFPKTGHPPTDVDSWKRILRIARAHGLNLLRFHSWCPPDAAFIAADELGFYFHVECSSWANMSTTLGDGKHIDRWIYEEADRILKDYGNHPSFVLMPYGNEPGGSKHAEFLAKWVTHYRAQDPRRLYTSASGWPQLPENQFHVTPEPRIQAWGGGLKSRINALAPETTTDYRDYISQRTVPVISHEIGQWCVYPNFDEIPKYTGYLKPRNFDIFRDRLEANGLGKLARQFLLASGKLQALCYKEDIESALRTPGMGGFELLDLHDFPGQGTALVGVLDPFWEEKGYITPREYSRFCNATVPLARLPRRVFTTNDRCGARIEIAHFGAAPLTNAVVEWRLLRGGRAVYAQGEFPPQTIPVNNAVAVGELDVDLRSFKAPGEGKLLVRLRGTPFENDWDLWVYPALSADDAVADVVVTSHFDAAARAHLRAGGKVLLTIPAEQVRNFDNAPVKLGFSSIFWNTAWTGRQAPTTLGILCDPKHPALAQFPTEWHSNWQWWYLLHRAGALRLDLLPRHAEPIVRVIDDWVTTRPLGLIVEGWVRTPPQSMITARSCDDPMIKRTSVGVVKSL